MLTQNYDNFENNYLPNPHRDVRATPKNRRTPYIKRTAGSTIKVTYADGTTVNRDASNFRAKRTYAKTTPAPTNHNTRTTFAENYALLASCGYIGNVE